MKTINDFIIEEGIAKLVGVSYVEEAKVVDEFLKSNPNIKYASVKASDGRCFQLFNERLEITKEDTFINPYYLEDKIINNVNQNFYSSNQDNTNKSTEVRNEKLMENHDYLNEIRSIKERLLRIENVLLTIGQILNEGKEK